MTRLPQQNQNRLPPSKPNALQAPLTRDLELTISLFPEVAANRSLIRREI
jgi:hypothetical protein